eukprot:45580_1
MAFKIKYTHLMISLMAVFMIIFVIDRFTFNVWPLYFTKKSPIIEGTWTASVFFIIGWICGRELIVASSFIWLLQCRCFWNWVYEHKPVWLIVDDIMIENNKMHYHLGWAMIAVPMIVHTWLVFLPLFQSHVSWHFWDHWMRPMDPHHEPPFYVESFHESNGKDEVIVSYNDITALIIITIVFLVLFPIGFNKKFKTKHWSIATYMHQTAALLYGIELLRTPFTAHCWFLCIPFIIMYIIDRILTTFYYRYTDRAKVICQYNFDNKYFLLCLNVPDIYYYMEKHENGADRMIGDVFWLNTKGFVYRKFPQAAHPFTSFFNHNDAIDNIIDFIQSASARSDINHPAHKFQFALKTHTDVAVNNIDPTKQYIMIKQGTYLYDQLSSNTYNSHNTELSTLTKLPSIGLTKQTSVFIDNNEKEWNVGFLMAVHKRNDKYGFTQRLHDMTQGKAIKDELDDNYIMSYGPYRSSFANIVDFVNCNDEYGAMILIGTGAGASYIIDTLLYFMGKMKSDPNYTLKHKIRVHFSCRSIPLYQWVTDFLWEECSHLDNVELYAYLTSHPNIDVDDVPSSDNGRSLSSDHGKIGRCSFNVVLENSPPKSRVFFCGHPRIQSMIKKKCKDLQFTFYEGHSFH